MKQNYNGLGSYWPDNQMNDPMNDQSPYASWQGYNEYNNYNDSYGIGGGYIPSSPRQPLTTMPSSNSLANAFYKGGRVEPKLAKFGRGGFFRKPLKATRSSVGSFGGAIAGNIIAPGIGGVIGGAIGQGIQHKIRGKKFSEGAKKGAAIGAAIPSVASLAGSGLNSMGYTGAGGYLSDYGAANAVLPSLGLGAAASSPASSVAAGGAGAAASTSASAAAPPILGSAYNAAPLATSASAASAPAAVAAADKSFLGSLAANSKSFFSQPMNLLSLGALGSMMLNRPKKPVEAREKTPEERASEEKRYAHALMMNEAELESWEKNQTSKEQAKRRIERNKFLPEERLGDIEPLYRKINNPEEYRNTGKWFAYYDNPEFSGRERAFKEGGRAREEEYAEGPGGLAAFFLEGKNGGQDDDRRVDLPIGSYIVDASTTANLGDGNGRAGFEKINALVSDGETYIAPEGVKRLGQGSAERGANLLDQLVKNVRKHKGGSTKLPPKAKSVAAYLKKGKK